MVLNIAHRGARSVAPENTLLAARIGFEMGADLWETDVSIMRDNCLILMHDDTLTRTTDVQKRFPARAPYQVWAFTLAEIRSLDGGSWFVATDPFGQIAASHVFASENRSFCGASVPTLEEALTLTKDLGWRVNLELKPLPASKKSFPLASQVATLIKRLNVEPKQVIISSFDHLLLLDVQQCFPELELQALFERSGPKLDQAVLGRLPFKTYNLDIEMVSDDLIKMLKENDKSVNLFTVNEISDFERFILKGVNGFFTDFPQRLARLKATKGNP